MRFGVNYKALRGCLATLFWSLNFRHSSLITHHSKFKGCLVPSLSPHHSICFTLFVDPTTVTWSEHFCFVTHGIPFHPHQLSLFSFSLLPLALSLSQSTNSNPKYFSTSLASSRPAVVANTNLSDVYGGAISSI